MAARLSGKKGKRLEDRKQAHWAFRLGGQRYYGFRVVGLAAVSEIPSDHSVVLRFGVVAGWYGWVDVVVRRNRSEMVSSVSAGDAGVVVFGWQRP